jgi:hypothetical protein
MEKSMNKLLPGLAVLMFACIAWGADVPASASSAPVSGKVLEVKDVDSYTYLRLKTKDGEIWAAVAKAPVKLAVVRRQGRERRQDQCRSGNILIPRNKT